jgi:hypothetical protein
VVDVPEFTIVTAIITYATSLRESIVITINDFSFRER